MISPRQRPKTVSGITTEIKTGCGPIYVTINSDSEGIIEVITRFGKNGSCGASQSEAISRLLTLAFQCSIDPEEVIRVLKGIRCCSPAFDNGEQILSCADAIAKVIQSYCEMQRGKSQ